MSDKMTRAERREQQASQVEESQRKLKASIAQTQRLVDESDEMLRRHRRECDSDEAEG